VTLAATAETTTPESADEAARPADPVRRRLAPPPPDTWVSWLATGVVVLVAAILRLVGLGHPKGKIFDELYYATEGHEIWQHGVEWRPDSNTGDFVVHPPLGKWLIGAGEAVLGYNETGWRIAAALAGTLSVLILVRLGRRLFRSTVLGCAAGLLMALDGMHLVLSRSALLDIFLMLFLLLAFTFLVRHRDQQRARWLAALDGGWTPGDRLWAGPWGPGGTPWWLLAAGAATGAAMAVKWSALWFVGAYLLLAYLWEAGLRRTAGVRRPWLSALGHQAAWAVVFGFLFTVVYLLSWSGWFLTDTGWDRHWLRAHGQAEPPVVGALENLLRYHREALHFHDTLDEPHKYQSWPWQWLLLGRPVAFYWSADGPCGADSCANEVLLLGTPLLWWAFTPVLAGLAWFGISRRDWRAGALAVGAAAGILPWFAFEPGHRTMFYFYALPSEPFLVLATVYVLGAIMRPAVPGRGGWLTPADRRLVGALLLGAFVLTVAACFAYFYPIYTGRTLTYAQWWARMWLGTRWV
jgi:dolichyl-phosphate-mannose-protein mannosyltransferase